MIEGTGSEGEHMDLGTTILKTSICLGLVRLQVFLE